MAKIDFNTKQVGTKIHDDGEYDLPDSVKGDSELPERFCLNLGETPPIVFDRYPGFSDAEVTKELDRIWNEEKWPQNIHMYYKECRMIKQEAGTILENSAWLKEKTAEKYGIDSDEYKAVLADRQDVRDKSNAQEEKLKAALLARKDPIDWPDSKNWDNKLKQYSNESMAAGIQEAEQNEETAVAYGKANGIENPGRKD